MLRIVCWHEVKSANAGPCFEIVSPVYTRLDDLSSLNASVQTFSLLSHGVLSDMSFLCSSVYKRQVVT